MSNHSDAIIPVLLSLVLSSAGSIAAEEQGAPEPPEVPLPELVVDGEVIEPEVTIIKREEGTIYEYRINGQLYMVKVQPDAGPPYYMIDRDGDGEFDSRSTDPTNISVPQWILMRW
ncbi:MAG: DUF2782 domain-containing protein [Candidatus Thiodiazotropha endolucinida]